MLSVVALVGLPMIVLGDDSGAVARGEPTGHPAPVAPVPSGAPTTYSPPTRPTRAPSRRRTVRDPPQPRHVGRRPRLDVRRRFGVPERRGRTRRRPAGWTQIFVDDFDTPVALGSFPGPYADSWLPYDGFTDTHDNGTYRAGAISVADGMMSLGVSALGDEITSSAVVPLVDGEWGGQTHGRYSVRLRSDPVEGFSAAFLLWSDDNDWETGEIDFPEGHLDREVRAYNHKIGDPSENSFDRRTAVPFSEWHTYTIEWGRTRSPSRSTA